MSGATQANLLAETRFRIFPDGTTDLDARILVRLDWTAIALAQILRPHELDAERTTQTFATGTSTYALPTDLLVIDSISIPSKRAWLDPISEQQARKYDENLQGPPRKFLRRNLNVRFYPIPDTGSNGVPYTERYTAIPPPLATTNVFPALYDELLVTGAAARVLRDRNETERAQAAFREWLALMKGILEQRGAEFAAAASSTIGVYRRASNL